ncbi:hypothetical protein [Bosea vaviloviae]|uniref:Uncharacterized protein n=1 Tax=Bosea vaviloviae TaxID=1526658 RepID=A0A0N1F603_9HYPH|nr:hypothetical protein [Bosea vaviloviae]KPH80521.1 hypothetical protein AE618_12110 [Bosea vaviloviae]
MSTEKKPYRVTNMAGFFVAGVKVPATRDEDGNLVPIVGHVLRLTEDEAKYELLSGSIELADEPAEQAPLAPPAKPAKKTKGP